MRQPSKISNLSLHIIMDNAVEINGAWQPARPLPFYYGVIGSILNRVKLAWLVFSGKADALVWINQED